MFLPSIYCFIKWCFLPYIALCKTIVLKNLPLNKIGLNKLEVKGDAEIVVTPIICHICIFTVTFLRQ